MDSKIFICQQKFIAYLIDIFALKSKIWNLHRWICFQWRKSERPFQCPNEMYPMLPPPTLILFSRFNFDCECDVGLDFRRSMVLDMACARRMDVHSINIEFVCHIAGSICGRHTSRYVSEHNVNKTGENAGGRRVGAVVRHLFAAANWT